MSSNQKAAGSNPRLPLLHVEVYLRKILNPKLLLVSRLAPLPSVVCMCVRMGECDKCFKVLGVVSRLEKLYRNAKEKPRNRNPNTLIIIISKL